jgi:hypothetical protein
MPHLDEADFVLIFAERFDNAIHAIAGNSEDRIDIPVDKSFNEYISSRFRHPVRISNPKVMRWAENVCSQKNTGREGTNDHVRDGFARREFGFPSHISPALTYEYAGQLLRAIPRLCD